MREKIGDVTTMSGEKYAVYAIRVMDVEDIEFGGNDVMWKIAARAVGIEYHEFQKWDFVDALKVVSLSGSYFNLFKGAA